ncbi:MAG: glycosyltransferase family 4 protein [Bacteroidetes bacterium]|nr:glycosyltransferase family 4 protein [Bacteroidota bacterium]MDA1122323.1 glycosyltransferase family 4 protein [Bacteroidota bacterium]
MAGSSYAVFNLAKGLNSRGHYVLVGYREGTFLHALLENSSINAIAINAKNKLDFKAASKLAKLATQEKIDIVFAQGTTDRYITIFARWVFGLEARLIHIRQQKPVGLSRAKGIFYTWGTDKIVAVSRAVKQFLMESGIPESHIEIINNSIPPESIENINLEAVERLKKEYGILQDDLVIGCVSRIKKQDQILKAIERIDLPIKVIFVGISDDYPHLKKLSTEISKKHKFFFTGEISHQDTLAHYPLFTMKILASDMEGFSLSLLEAMAIGVPVIATNASGNPDLIRDGENGLLFQDEDIEGLTHCINQIIENKVLRMKLIEQGVKAVSETSRFEKMIVKYESIYELTY